ncbi:MAG TPA: ABC transporter ATP-binding protein [Anaerolineae bacterium]|nr:ABC transporter ATP-binding protein [Anaerolineae bacterium]
MTESISPPAVEMRGIVKRFGPVIANNHVDFTLEQGEIHALLGENGAGKTTLMRILYGLYHPDAGEIRIKGQPVVIHSPKDAIAHGIGMVTQHFALAAPLTVAENVVLGYTDGFRLDLPAASQKVLDAARRFGIEVDPNARVKDLSVGQRQRVEILKALYRQADVLILDEPTAVLTPQEVEQLFEGLRRMQSQGLSVVFISHKLHEVMAITDRVTVLRQGEVIGTVRTQETTPAELARMMVGRPTFGVSKPDTSPRDDVLLRLEKVAALDSRGLPAVKDVTLHVRAGEILGLAGVSGNGQRELAQVLEGVRRCTGGYIVANGHDITNAGPRKVMAAGVGRIPEDRHESVVLDLTVAQNMALEHLDAYTRGGVLDKKRMRAHAEQLIEAYQIKARPDDPIRTLSGGNMQKVILARVLERNPSVIIVAQPTRGLDVGATEYVHQKLVEQRERGAAILLISEDLDEILTLSDRVAVMYEGEIMGIVPPDVDLETLGLLMSGVRIANEPENTEAA